MEILDLKRTITAMNNSPEGLKNRFELIEEVISKLEDRTINIQSEKQG